MRRIVTCLLAGALLAAWPGSARAEYDDEREARSGDSESSSESSRWTSESNGSSSSRRSRDDDDGASRASRSERESASRSAASPRRGTRESEAYRPAPMSRRAPPSWHTRLSASRPGAAEPERIPYEPRPVKAERWRPDRGEEAPLASLDSLGPVHLEIDRGDLAAAEPPDVDEPLDEGPAEERPPVVRAEPRRVQPRHRAVESHAAAAPVVDVAATSRCLARCGQSFVVRPRFGAAFLSRSGATMGALDAGVALGYLLDPRISLELRGDFIVPFTGETALGLDTVWLSLDLVWVVVDGRVVRPYLVVGAAMTIVPGDADRNLEPVIAGGGQAGLGLEVVLGRVVGVNAEVLGAVSGTAGEVLEGGVSATASVSFYF